MKTLLFIIIIILSVLEINLIFVIFFSPIIKLYFTIKKKRNNKRKISSTISIEPKKINTFIVYLAGFVRYYDLRLSKVPSHTIRNSIYKYVYGMEIGQKDIIYYGSEIREPINISIGCGTIIGARSIVAAGSVVVKDIPADEIWGGNPAKFIRKINNDENK